MEASIHKRVKSQCRGGPFTRIRKIGGKHLTSGIHTNIDVCISISHFLNSCQYRCMHFNNKTEPVIGD